ncbi:hypothetical protein [Roseimicrobium sp. ORNL1]|uniref:hypothetical protein n=1 Tax=Roseimicrobium sp. ORNL1 TaxID=2711231 RepID=UPI0013E1243D|nr:hypothetical protein [Roseimicrobium sp. ORNL1]QIF01986.1 hypothetical protein G5S37_10735 [Roseimicrobium sp. ORNL1]
MPRRSRGILAASIITVILLGLALAFYVVLGLPVNPLRFRPIAYLEHDMLPVGLPKSGAEYVHMAVENTSNSTVYLATAAVLSAGPSKKYTLAYLSHEEQGLLGASSPLRGYVIVIPPRSTVPCIASAPSGRLVELSLGIAPVQYEWTTDERYQLLEACERMYPYLPTRLRSHLPAPGMRHDTIPLELPPNTPGPSE